MSKMTDPYQRWLDYLHDENFGGDAPYDSPDLEDYEEEEEESRGL